jgi:hypothetical protein
VPGELVTTELGQREQQLLRGFSGHALAARSSISLTFPVSVI